MRNWAYALVVSAVACLGMHAEVSGDWPVIRTILVTGGLTQPLDIQSARDGSGRLFIVEQAGRIRLLKNGALLAQPFLDIRSRVTSGGEMGLLGLAFPPGFASKRYFYVNYTTGGSPPGLRTVVARFRVGSNADVADPASEETILSIPQPFTNHNAGQLAFGPDGFLYIGLGDGGSGGDPQANGQNTNVLLAKMLRIDVESGVAPYRVPASNPFVGRAGFQSEIWALGLRNPWRYSFDRQTGDLFIADVGQNRLEEIDFQPAASAGGENYGWNLMEGTQCFTTGCNPAGLVLPVAEYGRTEGCSVTGGYVYRGAFFPALSGIYFFGDYCTGNIWGLRRSAAAWDKSILLDSPFNISSFGEDDSGELFLANHASGQVFRLAGTGPGFSAQSTVNAASFQAGAAPGGLVSIFGVGLVSQAGIAGATGFPLPAELAGARVTVNGTPAPLLAVANVNGQEQINLQVPWEAAGAATMAVVVTNASGSSAPVPIPVSAAHPGVFLLSNGAPAVLRDPDFSVVSATSPAAAGDVLSLYATGLGAVTSPPPNGQPALAQPLSHVAAAVSVTVGARPAEVLFAGLAPGFAGLYQVNFRVPVGLAAGTQSLILSVGGVQASAVGLAVR